jgi:hypothetical protein
VRSAIARRKASLSARFIAMGMVMAHEDPHGHGSARSAGAAGIEPSSPRGGEARQELRPAHVGVIANVSADVLTAFVDNQLTDSETAHTDGCASMPSSARCCRAFT